MCYSRGPDFESSSVLSRLRDYHSNLCKLWDDALNLSDFTPGHSQIVIHNHSFVIIEGSRLLNDYM
jgi:hypothetical protein